MTIEQFTKHLNKTTSSIFSPTPPREPTLPRDLTPLRDEFKRKGIETKANHYMKTYLIGSKVFFSNPKIPSPRSFNILEGQMTNEDVMAQVKEMKRLADLKAEKEKSEKSLHKIMNPATIRGSGSKDG
ncbi:hypothetical protein Tco_1341917 [Tanacetum coccineum]